MTRAHITWNSAAVVGAARPAAARGLLLGAEHVLGEADRLVPLDEATLARSGTASVDAGTLTAAVSYDTPYAVPQHEDMTYQHLPGRQAKYLEQPAEAEANTALDLVAAEIRRALR
jgi:hypothetical protein